MLHHPSTSRSFANRQKFFCGEQKVKRRLSSLFLRIDKQILAVAAAAAAVVGGDNKDAEDCVADNSDFNI